MGARNIIFSKLKPVFSLTLALIFIAAIVPLVDSSLYDPSNWWDNDWDFRRPVSVDGAHPENFHLKVVIPYTGDMQQDFSDIRFVENENSGALYYWIENYTSDNATVWVRREENSDNEIFLYYGNPGAVDNSDWENTVLPYVDTQATGDAGWPGRYEHTSLAFGDNLWVLGGYDGSNNKNDVWTSSDGENWTQVTDGADWAARRGHTSVVFLDNMWVIGGVDTGVWRSENGENWTLATSDTGWTARWGHSSVVYDSKMWVIGGYDGFYKNDVWYSDNGDNWVMATSAAGWGARHGHTSVVYDDKIWVIGGQSSGGYVSDVWYTSDGENWTQATAAAGWSSMRNHSSVAFDNRIWVVGGNGELWAEYIENVWYTTDGVNWTQTTSAVDWSARYGHASVVFDDKIWVTGGYDGVLKSDVWVLLREFVSPNPTVTLGLIEPAWGAVESWTGTITATGGWGAVESWSGTITTPSPPTPPPPAKTSTSVTLSPSSFQITSGGSITISATLKDAQDALLSGKVIQWTSDAGTFSEDSGNTDNSGNIQVTYTGPTVTVENQVTITATFAGDTSYNSSQASSSGTITVAQPTSTSIAIEPSSFLVGSGENLVVVAGLYDENGFALSGKSVGWSSSAGSVAPSTAATDNSGRVEAVFMAPEVTAQTSLSVTVSFSGDSSYSGSNTVASGTVLIKEISEVLENLVDNVVANATLLGIEVDNVRLKILENSFVRGDIGAYLNITYSVLAPEVKSGFQHQDLEIEVKATAREKVELTLNSDVENGKTIILDIDNLTLPVYEVGEISVLFDGEEISLADDYEDVLDPAGENLPEYLILAGGKGIQVLVSVPRFSPHTLTITTLPTQPFTSTPPLYVVLIVSVIFAVALVLIFWRQISTGSRRLKLRRKLKFHTFLHGFF